MALRENDTIRSISHKISRYDTIRCISAMLNLTHGRQFVNECLLLLLHRLRAWPVQQNDDRSETADTGTCAVDLKPSDDRQCRSVTTRYRHRRQWRRRRGDRQVVSCTRSRTIDDVVSSATQPRTAPSASCQVSVRQSSSTAR